MAKYVFETTVYFPRIYKPAQFPYSRDRVTDLRYSMNFPAQDAPQGLQSEACRRIRPLRETGEMLMSASSHIAPMIMPKGGIGKSLYLAGVLFDAAECRVPPDTLLTGTKVEIAVDTFPISNSAGTGTGVALLAIEVDHAAMAARLQVILDEVMGRDE